MLQRFNHIDHALCVRAVLKFLNRKWYRPDVQREIQCYAGIDFREMKEADRRGSLNVKLEIAEALAMEAENLLETVEEQGPEVLTELLDPVLVRQRKDGMTGKVRDIAYLCVWHQILEHIAVCALEPLFRARITPWQHASLPGHGDARLRKQVQRYLRSGLGIQYAVKMDVHHAYGSLQYSRVLAKIREDIPSAKQILTLLDALALMAPGGHLIIGGYLDAWLFNLAMGYAVEDVMRLSKTRRGKRVRLVIRPQVYMDDVCLLGSRLADLKSAFREMGRYLGQTFSLVWGPNIAVTKFLTVQEEHRRKKAETRAGRGCPALDMGGWLFHRSYTTLRPRVYRMARRCVIRCNRDLRKTGTINWQRAQRYMSYNGRIVQADSANVKKRYNIRAIRKIGGHAIAWHDRKETINNGCKDAIGGEAA